MVRTATVADAIVFTARGEVRKMAGDVLRMKGVANVMTPADADAAVEQLDRYPKALLVCDWELGAPTLARVLGHNRSRPDATARPMLVVADELTPALLATAAEYHVSQVYTEPLQQKLLAARLASLLITDTLPSELKTALAAAAEQRKAGNPKGALATLQKMLAKHPQNPRLKADVAETLLALDEPEAALKLVAGMEEARPPYLRGVHLQGRALLKLGRFDEAEAAFLAANALNPHDVERWVEIGTILLETDRLQEAEQAFDRALAIDPKAKGAKVGKGKCRLADGAVNDALKLLREVAGDLEIASVFNTTAVMTMRRGKHAEGMSLYQAALKALGADQRLQARLYFNMGVGYRRWGKKDEAKGCFEEATRLDPRFSKAKEHLQSVQQPKAAPAKSATKPAPKPAANAAEDLAGLIDFSSELTLFDEDEDLEEGLYD